MQRLSKMCLFYSNYLQIIKKNGGLYIFLVNNINSILKTKTLQQVIKNVFL